MKTRVLGAVLASVLVLPGVAPAQKLGAAMGAPPFRTPNPAPSDRRPDPPRAERWETHRPAPGEDLFRARPWTYQPRYDRPRLSHFQHHLFFPGHLGFFGPVYAPVSPWPAPVEQREQREESLPAAYARPVAPLARPDPYTPGSPGPAKTLYVIRGCYAGDVLPRAEQLPDGCDAADLRTIAPR